MKAVVAAFTHLGEGPSRGLHRDYESSDGPSFQALVRCCAGEAATDETNCLIMKPDICEHNTNCSVCSNILEKYQIVVNPQINLRGSIKTEWIFILSKVYKTQIYLAWAPRVPKLTTIVDTKMCKISSRYNIN